MRLVVKELVLWSRTDKPPRRVRFEPGKVNVISGASKTGKSAVIPIIDYCLGSDRCGIPVGVIRNACSWFGVVVETAEGEKLLARREPGDQRRSDLMFVLEGRKIAVPTNIERHNTNADAVKDMLNRLAGLPNIGFEPDASGYKARASFRDLMAFLFQPQNVVANPDVLFFKADTAEHREKLKTIFPFVVGAITAEVLTARWEHGALSRELKRKERELKAVQDVSHRFQEDARAWLDQARELGLIAATTATPTAWPQMIDLLRTVSATPASDAITSEQAIQDSMRTLGELRREESAAAAHLLDARQRLRHLEGLKSSSESYRSALDVQRERLALSSWLRGLATSAGSAPLAGPVLSPSLDLERLCAALERIEAQASVQPQAADAIEKELVRVRAEVRTSTERVAGVRDRLQSLAIGMADTGTPYSTQAVDRFLGRLEQALRTFEEASTDSELADEVAALRDQVSVLAEHFSEADIRSKTARALQRIEHLAGSLLPKLDAEWPERPIKLSVPDLSIRVVGPQRDDWLWEIGSGANWLSYHVAISVALQRFFMESPSHPVPHLLVYDQPSQVYFPRRLAGDTMEPVLKDEDIVAVRKVFATLDAEVGALLQVIVLDHADADDQRGMGKYQVTCGLQTRKPARGQIRG